jgi:hypothetical protein
MAEKLKIRRHLEDLGVKGMMRLKYVKTWAEFF